MGFFQRALQAVGKGAKKAYNFVKQVAPAVNQGIKKGIAVGREVIKVGREVAQKLNDVPVVGAYAQTLANNPLVNSVDNALASAEKVREIAEFGVKTANNRGLIP